MPIPLSFTLSGLDTDEAKRSLTNFMELINQQKINIPDEDKIKLGEYVKSFNEKHIDIDLFKMFINDMFLKLGGKK